MSVWEEIVVVVVVVVVVAVDWAEGERGWEGSEFVAAAAGLEL